VENTLIRKSPYIDEKTLVKNKTTIIDDWKDIFNDNMFVEGGIILKFFSQNRFYFFSN
jgi:hypothetical protein